MNYGIYSSIEYYMLYTQPIRMSKMSLVKKSYPNDMCTLSTCQLSQVVLI